MINFAFRLKNKQTLYRLEAARFDILQAGFMTRPMNLDGKTVPDLTLKGFDVVVGRAADNIHIEAGTTGFCSTLRNIEGLYNLEQFELYHARACQVLRICEKHHLLEEVIDRSGWWETQNLDYLRAAGKSELSLMTLLAGSDNPMAQAMLKIAQAEH